jgi:peptide/nickel transport system permease protein
MTDAMVAKDASEAIIDPVAPGATSSPGRDALRMFFRNKSAVFGLILFLLILIMTVFGPGWYGVDPFDLVSVPLAPPGTPTVPRLGTDYLGRDVLAGVIVGGRATLTVAAIAAAMTVFIGILIGVLAGYYGGWVDAVLMRITEFFQVLPALLFAMVLVTLFSPSILTVAVAIGLVAWPGIARLARGEFLRLKNLEFVRSARAIGSSDLRIIWRVIFPNALPPLIVQTTLIIGIAILFEAGLSFLGLSDPNQFSWGVMIGSNRSYILDAWWGVTFPGIAIFLTVLSISLIGDGLQDAFNPKLRERS